MGNAVPEVVIMVMNAKAMNAIANKKLLFSDKDTMVIQKKGGWVDVERKGKTFSVRSDKAREIIKGGKQRYSKVGDRLYSDWIQTTIGGKEYTARRQVEGMQKKALKDGDMEMANAIGEVLAKSDAKVSEWYENWKAITSDKDIEEFYAYDSTQEFEDLLESYLQGRSNGF